MKNKLVIYTDGSTRIRNQKGALNKGGYGFVVYNGKDIVDAYGEQVDNTTNNRMELTAIIKALEKYGAEYDSWDAPIIYTDSSYVVMSLTQWIHTWKRDNWVRPSGHPVENADLMKQAYELLYEKDCYANIIKCPGHSGLEGNELADKLATGKITAEEVLKTHNSNTEN